MIIHLTGLTGLYRGDLLINNTDNTKWLVLEILNSTTITVRRWSIIFTIIDWNPCNNLMELLNV